MECNEQPIKRTGADEVTHEGLRVAENPNLVKYVKVGATKPIER